IVSILHCVVFHDACNVMLNCPRVTCSSSASIFARCSNKKLVTWAITPVLSRPMTVMVANCFMVFAKIKLHTLERKGCFSPTNLEHSQRFPVRILLQPTPVKDGDGL